jgi:hypothetical protein
MVLYYLSAIIMTKKICTVLGLIGVGIVGRLLPHLPNSTPISAVTIAASKHVGRTMTIAVPLMAMLLSDLVLGFYNFNILLSVYLSFALIALMSTWAKQFKSRAATVTLVLSSSLLFFLVTNGAVWLFSPWYAKNIGGLLYSYELGLPFLRNMLFGDIVYASVLLGALPALASHTRSVSTRVYYALRTRKAQTPTA